MKTTNGFLWGAFCLAFVTAPLFAQWVHMDGPRGGHVSSFAQKGDEIFAGISISYQTGVITSTDGGDSWAIPANNGFPKSVAFSFAVIGNNLFAATGDGVYMSTDKGTNWASATSGLPGADITALAANGDSLFAADWDSPVFLTTDLGISWKMICDSLPSNWAYALAAEDTSVYVLDGEHIYAVTGNGATWHEVDTGLPSVSVLTLRGQHLYAGTGSGLFVSNNGGASWGLIHGSSSWNVSGLAFGAYGSFCMTKDTVYVSHDSCSTWTYAGTFKGPRVDAFASIGDTLLVGTNAGGIFRSTDSGNSWEPRNNAFPYLPINSLVASGAEVFAATNSGVYRTTDDGNTWEALDKGMTDLYVRSMTQVSAPNSGASNLFAATSGNLYISTDQGEQWRSLTYQGNPMGGVSAFAVNGTVVVTGWSGTAQPRDQNVGGIYISYDRGQTWERKGTVTGGPSVVLLAFASSKLFAGVVGGWYGYTTVGLYVSPDTGVTWSETDSSLDCASAGAIAVVDSSIYFGSSCGTLSRSTDWGRTWTLVSNNLDVIEALVASGGNLFAGTFNWGLYRIRTVNDSVAHITDHNVTCLTLSNTDLIEGTYNSGVWRCPLSEIVSVHTRGAQPPGAFLLQQNYPNPFNPSTVISYRLPVSADVTLKVFDVLGREVETLIQEHQSAGVHSVRFNASNLPSGVYLYRLQAGNYSDTKKLLLLK